MRNRRSDIEKYLRGELSPAEMHALEKEALSDPFLAEALEGVEQAGADNFLFDLHKINRSIHDRSRRKGTKSKTIRMWGWTTAIAATVMLVAVSGFLVISILREQTARERAMLESARNELASVMDEDGAKDTVLIPLPAEVSVRLKEQTRQQTRAFRRGVAATAPVIADSEPPEEVTQTGDSRVEKNDEELLALDESTRQAEVQSKAEEEEARNLENLPAELPASKAVISGSRGEGKDADKKTALRAAGAEAQQRAPELSSPLRDESLLLKGKVVAADGQALPGVNIVVKGTNKGTVTDAEGDYELTVPTQDAKVVFYFIGYSPKEFDVKGQRELNVELEEDMTTLSEVVVTGYGAEGPHSEVSGTFNLAEPQGGRADFKHYLDTAVKYPQEAIKNKAEGKVTVRFTVETNGNLSDFEVIRGIGFGCEEELIRAIRQGPTWKPSSQGDKPLRDQVKVRYKFELPR